MDGAGSCLLAIVCRNPENGAVKTRLAPALGAEGARVLYRAFLHDLGARLGTGPHRLAWAYTPEGGPPPSDILAVGGANAHAFPQEGPDLGHRLLGIFRHAALAGYERTVVISSDVPHLPARVVHAAFEALNVNDLVLAPSEDGGYHLVAMRAPHDIFTMVRMSEPSVLAETRRAAEQLALRVRLLEPDFDVDWPEDLPRLTARLASEQALRESHTARTLRALGARQEEA